jgi:hypothetical protein
MGTTTAPSFRSAHYATPQPSRGSRATVELLRAYTGPQPSSPRLRRPRDSLRRLGRGGRRAALTLMTVFGFYFGAASAGWVPPVTGPFLQAQQGYTAARSGSRLPAALWVYSGSFGFPLAGGAGRRETRRVSPRHTRPRNGSADPLGLASRDPRAGTVRRALDTLNRMGISFLPARS